MEIVLYIIFFLSCLVLITVVLLQPGKTDAGALFTSNVSSNAFGPRGTATVLSKTTIAAATIFMLSALMLSMPALTGDTSVLTNNPDTPAESTTNAANTNANVDVNAVAPNSNSPVTVPPITDLSNSGSNSNTTSNAPAASNTNSKANANTKANTKANTNANANTKR